MTGTPWTGLSRRPGKNIGQPTLIILRTQIAFGSPNKAGSESSHGAPLGEEEIRATKENLGLPIPGAVLRRAGVPRAGVGRNARSGAGNSRTIGTSGSRLTRRRSRMRPPNSRP